MLSVSVRVCECFHTDAGLIIINRVETYGLNLPFVCYDISVPVDVGCRLKTLVLSVIQAWPRRGWLRVKAAIERNLGFSRLDRVILHEYLIRFIK